MKILLADSDGSHGLELAARLRAQDAGWSVMMTAAGENLLDAVRRTSPDVVLVDMARPDRDGLDSVRALNAQQMLPVLMFIDEDDPAFMEEAIASGISSYHVAGWRCRPLNRFCPRRWRFSSACAACGTVSRKRKNRSPRARRSRRRSAC